MHRLLSRQVRKTVNNLERTEGLDELIEAVNKTYLQFERELIILEESSEHMLRKIVETNENLHTIIEALDGFNYHVSHDLKNSMINTINLSKMLKKHLQLENDQRVLEIADKLEKTSGNGLGLVENFLRISKFESKLVDQELEEVNIEEVIESVIEATDLKGKFIYSFEQKDFDSIQFKALGMHSLLQNLITNAYKYKSPNEQLHVKIRLSKEGQHKVISFKDNGVGIDLIKNGDKLFKPFMRIDNNLNQEGTGVGLFLVKKVVVEHSGSIHVYSEPNQGTEFVLKF